MTLTLIKIQTFLKSLFFHVYAGFPKSSHEEINSRYLICISCDKLNHEKSECGICGCSISTKKIFMNKLAWKDQKCPEEKW
jgi:hypothetical protein